MKILFAIQGTGNGHLSRARDVYPELLKYGEVDVLISGIQADVAFPYPVKYKLYGMSFIFGKKGGVSIWQTVKTLKLGRLIRDIRALPVANYDLVVNDFEAVSAWACKLKKIPCISLSHQCAVLNDKAPLPEKSDWLGRTVLKHYAPVTAAYGFHFRAFAKNVFTPVIRKEIRELKPTNEGHYTVYLPAYDDETIVHHLDHFSEAKWQVFSKHNKKPFVYNNVSVQPINNEAFIASMASCTGLLCGAGFEGPAEALFLGKKVLAVPMENQYEQHCNAAGLKKMGVPIIKSLSPKYYNTINYWLMDRTVIPVDYPDHIGSVVATMMKENTNYYSLEKNTIAQPLPA